MLAIQRAAYLDEVAMRTLTKKYLGGTEVKEDRYKVDLAVLERYQAFSGEVLRLALLGIAGYGFLIANVVFKTDKSGNYTFFSPFVENKILLLLGVIALAASTAAALSHRFYSTDCLTHFVRRLRLTQMLEAKPDSPDAESMKVTIETEENSLDKDITMCRWMLIVSSSCLAIGAVCVALAFAVTLSTAQVPK
jgi:hypothetical protein